MPDIARFFALSALFVLAGAAFAPAYESAALAIVDSDFAPATMAIHAGDALAWRNKDIVDHTITARNGAFDVRAPVGSSGRLPLDEPGTYRFYCRFHPNMAGTIIVTRRSPAAR